MDAEEHQASEYGRDGFKVLYIESAIGIIDVSGDGGGHSWVSETGAAVISSGFGHGDRSNGGDGGSSGSGNIGSCSYRWGSRSRSRLAQRSWRRLGSGLIIGPYNGAGLLLEKRSNGGAVIVGRWRQRRYLGRSIGGRLIGWTGREDRRLDWEGSRRKRGEGRRVHSFIHLSCGRGGVHSNSAGFAGFGSASAGDGHRGRKIHFFDFIRICRKGVAVVEGENVGVARAARADDIIERKDKRAALAGGPESSVAASGGGARQFGESSSVGRMKKNSRTVAGNGVLRRASVSSEERSRK